MRGLKSMRPRISTIVLAVVFLAVLALYFLVRPVSAPAGATQPASGPASTPSLTPSAPSPIV